MAASSRRWPARAARERDRRTRASSRRSRTSASRAAACTCRRCPTAARYLLAAAIRSIGFDAWVTSDSDERTLELGGRVTSGDECYPQKITLGDFLRIIEDEGRDNVAFLMPTANGPCRFGQYLHLIRAKFDELGYDDVPVISITSSDGYSSIGDYSQDLIRTAWRAVLAQDILMKLLLKTRPYELEKGSTDAVYQTSLEEVGDGDQRASASRTRSARGDRARDGARPRPLPRHPRRLRPLAAAHRRRRRDLLPPEHVLQLRPHPRGRGAGRGVLAVRHRRVGVVHRRRAAPPAHRRGRGASARTTPSASSRARSCAGTSTPCTGRSTTTSSATRSRRTCARCSR